MGGSQEEKLILKESQLTEKVTSFWKDLAKEWKDFVFTLIWSCNEFKKVVDIDTEETSSSSDSLSDSKKTNEILNSSIDNKDGNCTKNNAPEENKTNEPQIEEETKQKESIRTEISLTNKDINTQDAVLDYDNLNKCKDHVFDLIWIQVTGNCSIASLTRKNERATDTSNGVQEPSAKRSRLPSSSSNEKK